jgi:pimeloyl-ACP methyl ester carboxylesterase
LGLAGCGGQSSFATLYDVGGYELYLECRGSGTPVVILEAGLGGGHEAWHKVERKLARQTRTCAYDRAGIGDSEPRPVSPVGIARPVHELHALLKYAGVHAPYVYVGHSIGGIYSLAYTETYPRQVAGAVYVDATNPASVGVLPDGSGAVAFSGPDEPFNVRLGSRPAIYLAANNSGEGYLAGDRNARLVQAVGSSHMVQEDRPGLVIEAVREVVDAVRDDKPLPACSKSRLTRVGGRCS